MPLIDWVAQQPGAVRKLEHYQFPDRPWFLVEADRIRFRFKPLEWTRAENLYKKRLAKEKFRKLPKKMQWTHFFIFPIEQVVLFWVTLAPLICLTTIDPQKNINKP
jgi:hypothetical protein